MNVRKERKLKMKKTIKKLLNEINKYEVCYCILNFCKNIAHLSVNVIVIYCSYVGVKVVIESNVKIEELINITIIYTLMYMVFEFVVKVMKCWVFEKDNGYYLSISEYVKYGARLMVYMYIAVLAFVGGFDGNLIINDVGYLLYASVIIYVFLSCVCKLLYKKAYPTTRCYNCGQKILPKKHIQVEKDILKQTVLNKEKKERGNEHG